jgi:nucleoside-diphosphate-sugar epimerase
VRVFVTGATGHIGSAVVPELLSAGHEVVGLARSEAAATALKALGAGARLGDLDDLDGLREAASAADGVIHLAFKHDAMWAGDYAGAVDGDLAAVRAFGEALAGTGKPFVGTSGTGMLMSAAPGRTGTEDDALPTGRGMQARVMAENTAIQFADRGVRSSVVRLPPVVHSTLDHHGFIPTLIATARAPACPVTSATAPTAGPPVTPWTPAACIAWPWSRRRPDRGCTSWVTKAFRSG